MKTLVSVVCFSLIMSLNCNGQTQKDFGVKGGLNITFFNVEQADFGPRATDQVSYYGGVFVEFHIREKFSLQPEMLYIQLNEFKFVNAPIYAKYEVAKNLDIFVGPSLNYFFDFFSNKLKIRGDVSTAFQVTKRIDLHIKYTLGFQVISPNGLFFGAGFRF